MSLKSRLLALLISTLLLIALAISAVDLDGLVETFLDSVRDRTDFTAQQVQTLLLQRIEDASPARQFSSNDEAKQFWVETVAKDIQLNPLLLRTMTSSKVIVEISIAQEGGVVLASSSPLRVGQPLASHPTIQTLQAMNAWRRFLETVSSRNDYEVRIPVGITNPPTPVFQIQVLASSVLQRNALLPHLRRVAIVSGIAVLTAILLSLAAAGIALRPLQKISQRLDQIASGQLAPPGPPGTSTKEFAIVQTKLDLLGEQFRGARQLIENLQEAILLIDNEKRIMLAGEPAQRMLGIPRIQLLGRPLSDALPPSTELGAVLAKALHLQLPVADRSVVWERDGQEPLRLLVNLEILPSGQDQGGALVTLRDAEGQRQIESQLDLSERLSAISRITGGVAHEIKNPLNAIALRLEVLRSKIAAEEPDADQEINIIADEVTRLDRVVKTFLDFNRPVELVPTEVDLRELLAETVQLVEPEAAAFQVSLNPVFEPNTAFTVHGDRDLLKQGFLNVMMNGIEAMGENGGSLRIKLDSLISSRQGRQAVIGISDSGPGIAAEHREKVFQLYFTTKAKGSGIGLAIAFRVAQLHGGKIEFSTNPGQGTSFIFLLPLTEAKGVRD